MVNPSTALAGSVACAAGLVVVKDAVAVLPAARLTPVPATGAVAVRFTPAFWKLSTILALPDRFTWSAASSGAMARNRTCASPPSGKLTRPVSES